MSTITLDNVLPFFPSGTVVGAYEEALTDAGHAVPIPPILVTGIVDGDGRLVLAGLASSGHTYNLAAEVEGEWRIMRATTASPAALTLEQLFAQIDAHESEGPSAHGGVVASTDARLTDARTPKAHAASHATGGTDAIAAADIGAQPLDADLTAIAALATAAFGRSVLTAASAAALLATLEAEATANKDTDSTMAANSDTRYPSQKAVKTALALKEALANKDTDVTLAANSDVKYPSQKAVKTYIDGLLAASDAVVYKGVKDCSANPNYPAAEAGHLYRVSVAGKIGGAAGIVVEVGDTLLCNTDGAAAGTQAEVGAKWNVIQANIDGAVVGPAAAVSGQLAAFNGTTGKIIADSGLALDTDSTMAASSDVKIPSQKAVKTALATKPTAELDTDSGMAANSDTKVASQKAVKTALATKPTAELDTDSTMAANSDAKVASQKATKTALATKPTAALDTDGTLAANSDAKVPSQKAVKTYARPAGSIVFFETHTFAVPDEVKVPAGDVDYLPPLTLMLATGQTAKIVKVRYRLNSGTSATVKLQKNGVDLTGFTAIEVKSGELKTTDPADQAIADGDQIALVVTAVAGAPKNMTFSVVVEHTVA